jgi:hypothetical protein
LKKLLKKHHNNSNLEVALEVDLVALEVDLVALEVEVVDKVIDQEDQDVNLS